MSNNTKQSTPKSELMTLDEMKELIEHLIDQTSWHPYTVDGLTFMFHTLATLAEQDSLRAVDDPHNLIRFIYQFSNHCSNAEKDFKEAMHVIFRKRDYSSRWSEESEEIEKEAILDLSKHQTAEDECIDLAKHLSSIIKNKNTPQSVRDGIIDGLGILPQPLDAIDSPEYIAELLKEAGCKDA